MAQYRSRTSKVGVNIDGWNPGFWIGGVTIDNRTLSWLSVDAAPGNILIAPLTLGWALKLTVAKEAISVKFVTAPFGGTPSQTLGDDILVTLFEADPTGIGIASNNGASVTPPVAAAGTKRTSSVLDAAVAAGGTTDITFPVGTIEYTVRVVDASLTPVAFTIAYASAPASQLHLVAGESYNEPNIGNIAASLVVRIGCAVAGTIEVLSWAA